MKKRTALVLVEDQDNEDYRFWGMVLAQSGEHPEMLEVIAERRLRDAVKDVVKEAKRLKLRKFGDPKPRLCVFTHRVG